MNFEQIDAEMKYNPPWYKDRRHFLELWNTSHITDHHLVILARLYTRYSHMDQSLILYALDNILRRFGLLNKQSLFKKTHDLYSKGYKEKVEKQKIY